MSQTGTSRNPLQLHTRLADVPGVRRDQTQRLERLGLVQVSQLLRHYPSRYEQLEAQTTIAGLAVETIGAATGDLATVRWVPGRGRGKGRMVGTLSDDTGTLELVWFNAYYLRDRLSAGMRLRVQGKVKAYRQTKQMVNPKWEECKGEGGRTKDEGAEAEETEPDEAGEDAGASLRPVYPATEGLATASIARLIKRVLPGVLDQLDDPLPADLLEHHGMPELARAIRMVHRPADADEVAAARRRLKFNELLLLQLGVAVKRAYVQQRLQAPALRWTEAIDGHIRERFEFALTGAQDRVVRQIAGDLQRTTPMNRLLQGDVGSGKTVVAVYAMLMAVADRRQAALLAPTELLAEQHHGSIGRLLEGSGVRVELMTASASPPGSPERSAQLRRIATGEADLVIGTQALMGESVRFGDLAVAVIDEQHRFGVVQRAHFRRADPAELREGRKQAAASGAPDGESGLTESGSQGNAQANLPGVPGVPGVPGAEELLPSPELVRAVTPHHLVMTATPIPRTLSLTVFGDLDVSTIDELPPGRLKVQNRLVPPDEADKVYDYLGQRLARGEQAYVVLPLIDGGPGSGDGEDGGADGQPLKNVRDHAAMLKRRLPGVEVAVVHGRLKRQTRERIMDRFRRGLVQLLVATTVIEVGVDVPNASVMVVEHAERFGLAQLHQLRGRVGRGEAKARPLCVFIGEPSTDDAKARLEAIVSTTDGFRIAEMDFEIRGMGELFGTRQHGLPPLRLARLPADMDLLQLARRDAQALVDADPLLQKPEHAAIKKVLLKQYGDALGLADVS
jgi:ATP-dependent DNA helicase RecG